MSRPTLVVFVKAPVIGGAKTRLAAGIGKVAAWRRHRAMSAQIIRATKSDQWTSVLAVSPENAIARRFPKVWPNTMMRIAQGAGDLGDRQARFFNRFRGPVCVIGSDAPQVHQRDIAQAFKALRSHDAVIGPAEDGGYWLLGLNAPTPPGVFDAVRWSHPQTRADLESRLNLFALSKIKHLRSLRDIDHKEDLQALRAGA